MLIQVSGFHKSYRETVAVTDLRFQLQAGDIMGLVGPNGAGKTSTLRSLAGIIPPTKGELSVDGYSIVHEPIEAKRRLAYVPDDPKLFDTLTVWEHLEFMAATYRVEDWTPKAESLLSTFELHEKRDTMADELSRGMRQKVAICCAYLHDPRVLLFDEPHTGLDPRGIRTMKNSVLQRAQAGAAVVVSSHLLELVEDLCSHLLILHKGECLFFGSMAEARASFGDTEGNGSLEEAFFRLTEGEPADSERSAAEA